MCIGIIFRDLFVIVACMNTSTSLKATTSYSVQNLYYIYCCNKLISILELSFTI